MHWEPPGARLYSTAARERRALGRNAKMAWGRTAAHADGKQTSLQSFIFIFLISYTSKGLLKFTTLHRRNFSVYRRMIFLLCWALEDDLSSLL